MLRYVSVVWDPSSPSACESAGNIKRRLLAINPSWKAMADQSGLLVCCTGNSRETGDFILLPNDNGVLLGSVFESSESHENAVPNRVTAIDAPTAKSILDSEGKSLVRSHWGSYVLFLRLCPSRQAIVLRSPMGSLSCFWIRYGQCTVFFSRIEDCIDLQLIPFTINWDCIRAQAAGGDYLTGTTAINEIETAVGGECITVRGESLSRTLCWNPCSVSSQPTAKTLVEAASLLREATQYCVNAWLSLHSTVLLELSGGLDSSILLACMCRARTMPHVIAVNLWSQGSADERSYARSMADKTGTELLELELDQHADLRRVLNCARTGNPVVHFSAFDIEPRLIRLAHDRKATAIFTGELGDDIFGHSPAPEVLAESFASFGPSLKFFRAAIDYATLTRTSVWAAIGEAVRYRNWQRETSYWSIHRYKKFRGITSGSSLTTDEAAQRYEHLQSKFVHPWFHDVRGMPFGRAMLIWATILSTSTWSHSPFAGLDGSLFAHPLVSQPLIETFCRIPSRLHFLGGENGAVARYAFESDLSEAVIGRGTGKGSPDLWIKGVMARNRSFMREVLVDGILVREGILDKRKLETALSGAVSSSRVGAPELIMQLYAECWLRQWLQMETRAVA